jgi:4-hydroxybenzoate polyprenyltransferase
MTTKIVTTVGTYLELFRARQWVKNGFVLAALFFGANLLHVAAALQAAAAFVVFCLMSSAVYIFNDWRDLDADFTHAKKKFRPLPSGRVSVPSTRNHSWLIRRFLNRR